LTERRGRAISTASIAHQSLPTPITNTSP